MLVTANHILHQHNAVDGFGHISVRHPQNASLYIMSGYLAPALVSTADDLIEYNVEGSMPVDPNAGKGYSERFIHGEMYKRWTGVNCVVHSHAEAVLPYVASDVPLLPMYHMAGFQGSEALPVWDITPLYEEEPEHQQDMLVNEARFGEGLADSFAGPFSNDSDSTSPAHTVVLMKRHGCATWGPDIPTAVDRTLYTLTNAGVQTNAMAVQAAARAAGLVQNATIEGLGKRQADDCRKMNEGTQDKAWQLWEREVEVNALYQNKV